MQIMFAMVSQRVLLSYLCPTLNFQVSYAETFSLSVYSDNATHFVAVAQRNFKDGIRLMAS